MYRSINMELHRSFGAFFCPARSDRTISQPKEEPDGPETKKPSTLKKTVRSLFGNLSVKESQSKSDQKETDVADSEEGLFVFTNPRGFISTKIITAGSQIDTEDFLFGCSDITADYNLPKAAAKSVCACSVEDGNYLLFYAYFEPPHILIVVYLDSRGLPKVADAENRNFLPFRNKGSMSSERLGEISCFYEPSSKVAHLLFVPLNDVHEWAFVRNLTGNETWQMSPPKIHTNSSKSQPKTLDAISRQKTLDFAFTDFARDLLHFSINGRIMNARLRSEGTPRLYVQKNILACFVVTDEGHVSVAFFDPLAEPRLRIQDLHVSSDKSISQGKVPKAAAAQQLLSMKGKDNIWVFYGGKEGGIHRFTSSAVGPMWSWQHDQILSKQSDALPAHLKKNYYTGEITRLVGGWVGQEVHLFALRKVTFSRSYALHSFLHLISTDAGKTFRTTEKFMREPLSVSRIPGLKPAMNAVTQLTLTGSVPPELFVKNGNFLSLPVEVMAYICSYLLFVDVAMFALTCRKCLGVLKLIDPLKTATAMFKCGDLSTQIMNILAPEINVMMVGDDQIPGVATKHLELHQGSEVLHYGSIPFRLRIKREFYPGSFIVPQRPTSRVYTGSYGGYEEYHYEQQMKVRRGHIQNYHFVVAMFSLDSPQGKLATLRKEWLYSLFSYFYSDDKFDYETPQKRPQLIFLDVSDGKTAPQKARLQFEEIVAKHGLKYIKTDPSLKDFPESLFPIIFSRPQPLKSITKEKLISQKKDDCAVQ
eukprot:TRINITY_DN7756_c0_g1_i2.p1 TRINITY_DN7756_c0_g1~~TRINITY_DN7756_c0_g1_i2.p1  ORF type:complete len:761 (-),score=111.30 TRINITY_DN7756_c0_g1_i2:18-2300(-)